MSVKGMPQTFELDEILTEDEIALALRFYKRSTRTFHKNCLARIVEPAWDRIVQVLGPCTALYVAYGIEYRCLKRRKQVSVIHKHADKLFHQGRRPKRKRIEKVRNQWDTNLYPENLDSERYSL